MLKIYKKLSLSKILSVVPISIFLIQMYGIEKKNLKHGSEITAKFDFSPC